jgi:hypothetical protein
MYSTLFPRPQQAFFFMLLSARAPSRELTATKLDEKGCIDQAGFLLTIDYAFPLKAYSTGSFPCNGPPLRPTRIKSLGCSFLNLASALDLIRR